MPIDFDPVFPSEFIQYTFDLYLAATGTPPLEVHDEAHLKSLQAYEDEIESQFLEYLSSNFDQSGDEVNRKLKDRKSRLEAEMLDLDNKIAAAKLVAAKIQQTETEMTDGDVRRIAVEKNN